MVFSDFPVAVLDLDFNHLEHQEAFHCSLNVTCGTPHLFLRDNPRPIYNWHLDRDDLVDKNVQKQNFVQKQSEISLMSFHIRKIVFNSTLQGKKHILETFGEVTKSNMLGFFIWKIIMIYLMIDFDGKSNINQSFTPSSVVKHLVLEKIK